MITKKLLLAMVVLGLTFIYSPSNNTGFVYINDSLEHAIILLDPGSNSMSFYAGTFIGTERFDQTIQKWFDNMVRGGFDFKATIIPYIQEKGKMY